MAGALENQYELPGKGLELDSSGVKESFHWMDK